MIPRAGVGPRSRPVAQRRDRPVDAEPDRRVPPGRRGRAAHPVLRGLDHSRRADISAEPSATTGDSLTVSTSL
jgi:hypothetical protein